MLGTRGGSRWVPSMRRTVTITLLTALAVLATGCGGTTVTKTVESTHSPGNTASPSPDSPPAESPGSQAGQVGDTFTINTSSNGKYDVTLLSVDQQAQPDSEFSTAKVDHHLAAAEFRVTAITSTDENANLNATVTGSNDQLYLSSSNGVTAGTNFASGQILLQPRSSLVGWVSFEVPNGVRVTRVQWTPSAGFSAHNAEWLVNSSAQTSPSPAATPTTTATATAAPTATYAPPTAGPGPATDPAETVIAYFDAINNRDFQKAWSLGGKNTTSSYSSFVSGFNHTAMVSVQILGLSGGIGTGVVTARLTTLESDGTSKIFEGTYTVRNGIITKFNVHQVS